MLKETPMSYAKLAKIEGVSESTIGNILSQY